MSPVDVGLCEQFDAKYSGEHIVTNEKTFLGPRLLKLINFGPSMDKWLYPL